MRRRMELIRHHVPSPGLGVVGLLLCAVMLGIVSGGYLFVGVAGAGVAWRLHTPSPSTPARPGPVGQAPAPGNHSPTPGPWPPDPPRTSPTPAPATPAPGPSTTEPPTTGPVDIRIRTGSRAVALTFDDGPSAEYTPQFLDELRDHDVHATFCLVGAQVDGHPGLVRRIVREGHTLCNHSWQHDLGLGSRSVAEIRADLRRTSAAIQRAVPGARVPYFRQPGGKWTPRVVAVATGLGMKPIGWEVDPRDWDAPATPESVADHVRRHTRTGSIVLMHDGGGDRSATLGALKAVLPDITERFALVALPTRPAP